MSDVGRFRFPFGFPCDHGYPPGEYCPVCGEVPVLDPDEFFDEENDRRFPDG